MSSSASRRVDDQRQPGLARGRDMACGSRSAWSARGAVVVVVVETRLPDGDHLRDAPASATISSDRDVQLSSSALCGWVPTEQ